MLKQEFLNSLQRSLVGNLEYSKVEEHVHYYSEYIDSRLRQGISEEEVMRELGDPRLIAKTLVGVGDTPYVADEFVETDKEQERKVHNYSFNGRNIVVPAWISSILLGTFLVVILGLFFALLGGLLRFAFPILMVVFVIRLISKIFK